jgi:hypothetical protein
VKRALAVFLVLVLLAPARAEDVSPEEGARRLERAAGAIEAELERAQGRGAVDPGAVKEALGPISGARVRQGDLDLPLDRSLEDDLARLGDGSQEERLERLERISARTRSLAREAARVRAAPAPATEPADPAAPTPAANVAPDVARGELQRVLSRPRFRRSEPGQGGLEEKVSNLIRRIENWWIGLLTPRAGAPASTPGPIQRFIAWIASLLPTTFVGLSAWVAVAAIAAVSAVLVYRKARGGLPGSSRPTTSTSLEDVGVEKVVETKDEPVDEASWREESRALAARGDLRGSLRAIYQVVLLVLQRAGRIRLEKGRTNWEHVDEVRRRDPALAGKLEPLTMSFDLVWYGRRQISKDELERATSVVDGVANDVSAPEKAAP